MDNALRGKKLISINKLRAGVTGLLKF